CAGVFLARRFKRPRKRSSSAGILGFQFFQPIFDACKFQRPQIGAVSSDGGLSAFRRDRAICDVRREAGQGLHGIGG
ncbi:MAG: hypothetical protein ACE145_13675, partial [Terriglobia bacterium]